MTRTKEFDNLALSFVCLFADLLNRVGVDTHGASSRQVLQVFLNFQDLGLHIYNILSSPSQNFFVSRFFLLLFLIVFLECLKFDSIILVLCEINRTVNWELVLLRKCYLWPWCPQFRSKSVRVYHQSGSLNFDVLHIRSELISFCWINRDILQRKVAHRWLLEHRHVTHLRLFLHPCGDHHSHVLNRHGLHLSDSLETHIAHRRLILCAETGHFRDILHGMTHHFRYILNTVIFHLCYILQWHIVHLRHILNWEFFDIRFFVHGLIDHNWNILDAKFSLLWNILQTLILHRFYILNRHVLLATVEDSLACLKEQISQFDIVDAWSGNSCKYRRLGSLRVDDAVMETCFLVATFLQAFWAE